MPEISPGAGRPRNLSVDADLKVAALELIRKHGYGGVSISAIVKEAGVSRQTLYSRWETKAELVLDAFFDLAGSQIAPPVLESGLSCRALLARFLEEVFDHLALDGETLRSLIAAAQTDPGFREIFWSRFVAPRGRIVTNLLRTAQDRGELDPRRNVALLSAFLHGTFWYRLLNGLSLDAELAEAITEEIFRE